jgi:hypothetical protein
MYLTYLEYRNYGGTADETTFNDLEFEASSVVDWYTFNRLQNEKEYPEAVKRCVYKIIQYIVAQQQVNGLDTASAQNNAEGAGIASQSNDGVSVSYNVLNAKDVVENSKAQIKQIVDQYLSAVKNSLGQKVLYRGVYPNE